MLLYYHWSWNCSNITFERYRIDLAQIWHVLLPFLIAASRSSTMLAR